MNENELKKLKELKNLRRKRLIWNLKMKIIWNKFRI
jgi:hypothetical protein